MINSAIRAVVKCLLYISLRLLNKWTVLGYEMEFSEPPVKRFRWTDYDSQDQTSTHSFALANRCEDDDKESVHSWQSDETGKKF